MNLLVINYSMREDNIVFSHQRDAVLALSPFFDRIEVFTTESDNKFKMKNVRVHTIPWNSRAKVKSVLRTITTILPSLLRNRNSIMFTHMTDLQAAIISPFTRLLKIKHIFWYAHAHNSPYLIWSSFFVDKLVSSTQGSCNLSVNRKKLTFINQGIDNNLFAFQTKRNWKHLSLLNFGRLDESKNIHLFPLILKRLQTFDSESIFTCYGKGLTNNSSSYFTEINRNYADLIEDGSLRFFSTVPRHVIPEVASNFNIYINLFSGSLDKALIESTFMGLPVVTWNREYCSQFGTWSKKEPTETLEFIVDEIKTISSLSKDELIDSLLKRRDIALKLHSFSGWIERLVKVLKN